MFIIAWLAKILIARDIPARVAGFLSWGIAITMALTLIFVGWQVVKHYIIRQHDAEQRADAAEGQLARVGSADNVDAVLENRDDAADEAVRGAIDHAVQTDSAHGASPVGPVSNAAVDELRKHRRSR